MVKYVVIIPLICLLAVGCNQAPKETSADERSNKDSLKTVLMGVDKGWSDLAQKKGYYRSRLEFLCENSINIVEGKMPIEGRKAIEVYVLTHKDTTVSVEWKPLRAEVAASGELGYTFGGWTMKTKTKAGNDTILCGSYTTIWHKQPDGSWKYIFDEGNVTPIPVKE